MLHRTGKPQRCIRTAHCALLSPITHVGNFLSLCAAVRRRCRLQTVQHEAVLPYTVLLQATGNFPTAGRSTFPLSLFSPCPTCPTPSLGPVEFYCLLWLFVSLVLGSVFCGLSFWAGRIMHHATRPCQCRHAPCTTPVAYTAAAGAFPRASPGQICLAHSSKSVKRGSPLAKARS
jgi:hypothetical protein